MFASAGVDLAMESGPNPFVAAASMLRAQRVSSPRPDPTAIPLAAVPGSEPLSEVLEQLRAIGSVVLGGLIPTLDEGVEHVASSRPNEFDPPTALAFWLNAYNLGALRLTAHAYRNGEQSVLDIARGFTAPVVNVDGERLSLDDIEHGKIRRFGDPRIHAALVCGSVSCPTLRWEPFSGTALDEQLNDQMRTFLRMSAAQVDPRGARLELSRVFKWYGSDFVRPDAMPLLTVQPARSIANTVAWWMDEDDRAWVWETAPAIEFQSYDWGLGCSVAADRTP